MSEQREAMRIILAGLGGQGVVFATRVLAQTAVVLGRPVVACETHGMTQRGGSVLSHVTVGGDVAPAIRRGTADVLLAFDHDEGLRNLSYLRPGAVGFVNTRRPLPPQIREPCDRLGLRLFPWDATTPALELGSPAVANMLLVGYAAAHPAFELRLDVLRQALLAAGRRAAERNRLALDRGYRAGQTAFGARIQRPIEERMPL